MDLAFAPSQMELWPLDRLRPYTRNAKIHGADQVAKIAASMAKFGWTVPCLMADDGGLIAGHGRVFAAIMLGAQGCTGDQTWVKCWPRWNATDRKRRSSWRPSGCCS